MQSAAIVMPSSVVGSDSCVLKGPQDCAQVAPYLLTVMSLKTRLCYVIGLHMSAAAGICCLALTG